MFDCAHSDEVAQVGDALRLGREALADQHALVRVVVRRRERDVLGAGGGDRDLGEREVVRLRGARVDVREVRHVVELDGLDAELLGDVHRHLDLHALRVQHVRAADRAGLEAGRRQVEADREDARRHRRRRRRAARDGRDRDDRGRRQRGDGQEELSSCSCYPHGLGGRRTTAAASGLNVSPSTTPAPLYGDRPGRESGKAATRPGRSPSWPCARWRASARGRRRRRGASARPPRASGAGGRRAGARRSRSRRRPSAWRGGRRRDLRVGLRLAQAGAQREPRLARVERALGRVVVGRHGVGGRRALVETGLAAEPGIGVRRRDQHPRRGGRTAECPQSSSSRHASRSSCRSQAAELTAAIGSWLSRIGYHGPWVSTRKPAYLLLGRGAPVLPGVAARGSSRSARAIRPGRLRPREERCRNNTRTR